MRGVDADGPDEEAALVRSMVAYQAGELAGFEELYAALADDLERFFAAAQGDGTAKDLVQDAFLEIHRSRRTYLPPLPVRPWVFGLACNVLRRHRRAAWRRARHECASGAVVPAPAPSRFAFDTRDVAEALRRVPSARRDAWVLRHVYGWSFQEIAVQLRIGVVAAKLRSSRAMRSLRRALGVAPPNRPARSGRDRDGGEGGARG
jgi:RNA polymerase sigma factor (sigma-70 family)